MQLNEKNFLTKTIFTEALALIESSSDFIVILYELCRMADTELFHKIDSIYKWEHDNWHIGWEKNVDFINKKMVDLSSFDYDEILDAYTAIYSYFIEDETISKLYNLGIDDNVGWTIFKELSEKRKATSRMKNLMILKAKL
jgi:hypothetical protein